MGFISAIPEMDMVKARSVKALDEDIISVINGRSAFKIAWENAISQFRAMELVFTTPTAAQLIGMVRPLVIFFNDNNGYILRVDSCVTKLASQSQFTVDCLKNLDYMCDNVASNLANVDLKIPFSTGTDVGALVLDPTVTAQADGGISGYATLNKNVFPTLNVASKNEWKAANWVTTLLKWWTGTYSVAVPTTPHESKTVVTLPTNGFRTVPSTAYTRALHALGVWFINNASDIKTQLTALKTASTSAFAPAIVEDIAADIFCMVKWMRTVVNAAAALTYQYIDDEVYNNFSKLYDNRNRG